VLAARVGYFDEAFKYFKQTTRLDLDNYNQDTEDGLHITSMSGGWLAICHGFAGMETTHGQLPFKPFLPQSWDAYSFNFRYRGTVIQVNISKEGVAFESLVGKAISVREEDNVYKIEVVTDA
jgi:maltose phosphorylase